MPVLYAEIFYLPFFFGGLGFTYLGERGTHDFTVNFALAITFRVESFAIFLSNHQLVKIKKYTITIKSVSDTKNKKFLNIRNILAIS